MKVKRKHIEPTILPKLPALRHIASLRIFYFFIITLCTPSITFACPDQSLYGEQYQYTGRDLYTPRYFDVVAGGENSMRRCGRNMGISGETGFFTTQPDFTFNITNVRKYSLEIAVVSDCDSALLVNTPDGMWFYDDDSNGALDPFLNLTTVPDGWLDIWIGTYDGEYCNATLRLETM
jgi:hypothetical protein